MKSDTINIAILAGGNSSEFFISLKSAENIAKEIDKSKYTVFRVQIKQNEWTLLDDLSCGIPIDKNDFSFSYKGQKETFDLVISAIHGTPGEDGLLQAYFDMLSIPYVGSGVLASSLTFNKYYCNKYLKQTGAVNIAESVLIRKDKAYCLDEIIEKTALPCFVKPAAGGSSFGVSKVKKKEDFEKAVNEALKESNEVIVEQFIEGKEIQCGLFKTKGRCVVLPLVEIVSKNEFFDYQAKYDPDFADEIIPARISGELTAKCQNISSKLYDLLNCKGIVRIDFILQGDAFWFLEVNTVPGMTNESLVPQMIKKTDMTVKEIMSVLIEDTLKNK